MTAPAVTSGSPPYFQVLTTDSGWKFGKNLTAGSPNIRPGHVVELMVGGAAVRLCPQSGSPFGQAYGGRELVSPSPTTEVFTQGDYLSVAQGSFMELISAFFWATGIIPTNLQTNAPIYTANNGLLTLTAGGTQVGRFIRQKNITQVGGQVAIALCQMHFVL